MIFKEQIAHDLTIIYMKNRYGIDISDDLSITDGTGAGTIGTEHFPSTSEPKYIKVGTGEKGFFGMERKKKIESGLKVDDLFDEMVDNYFKAYSHFINLLSKK